MNKKTKNPISKKVMALAAASLLVVAGGGVLGGANLFPTETIVEVPVETIVEVPVEVEVDNGKLDTVLNYIYDNDEVNMEFLTDDLDDDEVELIADRIVFINEIKDLAVAELKVEAVDEIDGKQDVYKTGGVNLADPGEIDFDDDELERVRVQDDDNEVIVTGVDFEDSDADVAASVNFEYDDVKYVADFNVEIKDGEVDEVDLLKIRLR